MSIPTVYSPMSLPVRGLQPSAGFPVFFQDLNGGRHQAAHRHALLRSVTVQQHAQAFYQEVAQKGADEGLIKDIFRKVHQQAALAEFNQAVSQLAAQDGHRVVSVEQLVREKLMGNPMRRFFKSVVQRELLDLLYFGKSQYRSSAWEYRRYGMWRSVADFAAVCKEYPLMSTGVIGSVAYLGHKYPFLGGVSGIAIIAWGGAVALLSEIKAKRAKGNLRQRAAYYERSGENLAAALITGVGIKGIKSGAINGFERAKEVADATHGPLIKKAGKGVMKAIGATPKEEHQTNLFQSFLFVSGLFDNVLLPFNWLADKLKSANK